MSADFQYDVFLGHSAKDKEGVRPLAERLRADTFRFRDPLNQECRFIPLRLDNAPTKGSLPRFLYIKWLPAKREQEYAKLLQACALLVCNAGSGGPDSLERALSRSHSITPVKVSAPNSFQQSLYRTNSLPHE
jgi:hypothetical protein